MQYAERLRAVRRRLRWNQDEMGRYLGRGREWISRLENDQGVFSQDVITKLTILERVPQHMNVTPDNVLEMFRVDELPIKSLHQLPPGAAAFAADDPEDTYGGMRAAIPDPRPSVPHTDVNLKIEPLLRFVPVISWTHAGEAVAYEQIPQHEQERVSTMSTDPRAFAIIVEGESMLPDFKPGDRVIVAPSREPRNGKPCVIKLMDDGVLLRVFHRVNSTTVRLTSLRPDIYPSTELKLGEYRWCWPVEELNRRV